MRALRAAIGGVVLGCTFACASFREGAEPPPGGDAPGADDGGASVDGAESCPTDALACHFFDGALVQGPWQATGDSRGQFLQAVTEGARTLGRIRATKTIATAQEDRLSALFKPARTAMEIELDFRINEIASDQVLEIASLMNFVDSGTYHFIHLTLNGRRAHIAEFGQPDSQYFREQSSDDLADGWHHAKLSVDYEANSARLQIDQNTAQVRSLAFVPSADPVQSEAMIGLGSAPRVLAAFSVDMDTVVVRGRP